MADFYASAAAAAAIATTYDLQSLDVEDYDVDVMELKDDQNYHLNREDAFEEHVMVEPISSYQPVAPKGSRKRPLKGSVVTGNSKLSFTYDAKTRTVTRFRLGVDDEVMAPAGDELGLRQPALLKGWEVEHRRRVDSAEDDRGDKYYTHPQHKGHTLKSLKQVEALLKMENFEDLSVTFRDAVPVVKRPRGVKRQRTPEEMAMRKAYVERYLKDAWDNLMNRPADSLPVETGDDEMPPDGDDDSRPPGYYGVEPRYQPFSV